MLYHNFFIFLHTEQIAKNITNITDFINGTLKAVTGMKIFYKEQDIYFQEKSHNSNIIKLA